MKTTLHLLSICLLASAGSFAYADPSETQSDAPPTTTEEGHEKASSAGKGIAEHETDKTHLNSDLIPRDLPYLHILGTKNHKFYAGIGGVVKGTASFDFGHVLDNPNEFIVSAIPMTQPKGDGGKYQVSAQQTELYLMAGFNPGEKYEVTAYVNGRFLNDNYGFQLENAYVGFMGFTIGYGYGLFCDTWAAPSTIDYEGPNAMIAVTNGIFDYRHKFGRWTVGAGIELPMASFTHVDGINRKVNQRIPDIPLMVNYSWDNGNRIGASVMFRGLQYRNILKDKNETKFGWGVRLSGNGKLYGPLDFFFQGMIGKGSASYIQDLSGTGMDLVPCGDNGKMDAVRTYGLMGGLQYNFSEKVFASAAYSHVRAYADKYNTGSTPWNDMYSYGQYAVGNVMWQITPMLQCGLEYIYGRRVNMDGAQAHDNRLQTMLQVSF